jgi:hypothetical protein
MVGTCTAVLQTAIHEYGVANKHELMWWSFNKNGVSYIVGVLYHPPGARYNTNELVDRLKSNMPELVSLHPNSSLFLVGDFNRFNLINFLICKLMTFDVPSNVVNG